MLFLFRVAGKGPFTLSSCFSIDCCYSDDLARGWANLED